MLGALDHPNYWTTTALFIGLPSLMILFIYLFPMYSPIWIFISIALLIIFIYFLFHHKKENFLLVAAIVPNTVGPLISGILLSLHRIPDSPNMDLLVGYSFHISSLLALSLYVLFCVDRNSLIKVSFFVILALFINITLSPPSTVWHSGPDLFWGLSAPAASPLFIGRCVLTILSAHIALNHPDVNKPSNITKQISSPSD